MRLRLLQEEGRDLVGRLAAEIDAHGFRLREFTRDQDLLDHLIEERDGALLIVRARRLRRSSHGPELVPPLRVRRRRASWHASSRAEAPAGMAGMAGMAGAV